MGVKLKAKAKARLAKIKLFVEAYCANGGNGTDAYIDAGFTARTRQTAAVESSKLLSNPKISKLVEEKRAAMLKAAEDKTLLTAHEVLQDLAEARRFDPAKMYGEDGQILPVRDMPPEVRMHLEGVEVDEIAVGKGADRRVIGQTVKVKYPKKSVAREQAMKHFGLFEKDNKQQAPLIPPVIEVVGIRAK